MFNEFDDAISKNAEDIKDLNSSLTSINGELGGLKETINGVGSDLSDLSRVVNTFMGEVGNLEDLVLTEESETLVDQVNYLTQQLTWQEIVKD